MRVGQKNGMVYQWAKKGTRPRQPKDQRYANAYVFGAICPARDTGAALVLPRADASTMQLHLDQVSRCVADGAHAVLTLDKAGWHTTRKLQSRSISASCTCRPPARSSTRPRTSGSSCAKPISQIGSSATMTTSSKSPVQPGTSSSPSKDASHQSAREAGPQSVKVCECWYKIKNDTRSEPRLCHAKYEAHKVKDAGIFEK
jgi:hypothetical protein